MVEVWPGRAAPLGATCDASGVNFAVFSEVAERVELCLFDDNGVEARIDLPECEGYCWHGYVRGIRPGQRYGYRMHGPWNPAAGRWTNPAKLLIDPYAKAIDGDVCWDDAVFDRGARLDDQPIPSPLDDAACMPRSVVIDPTFDWKGDRPPATPWHDTVIYEAHVKGLTQRFPDVPAELRGTFLGVSHPATIGHLRSLGVTAIELLPVHHFVHDRFLVESGKSNYWGYSSIGFLAPHHGYVSNRTGTGGEQVNEFKTMVRDLHAAGLEVILDVVYNHTGEGDHLGPTLAFRGIDNAAYYRLDPTDQLKYVDYTGTGNTLDAQHPHVLQLIMDSLRYWVQEMHVDGFRFDLAAALARGSHEVERLSSFFDLIGQDPVVQQVKLIAEPWDVGDGGYQVGNFPPPWTEWNDKYRDTVRDHWRGFPATFEEFATRLAGSSDLYRPNGRRPLASINLVTCHDGFTLRDLVSYDHKHNLDNGEANRDGSDDNRSANAGVEGPTDDPLVNAIRSRRQRAMLATLFVSQGVPMLLAGDEMGRTQGGNNNAYCQDNAVSWIDWDRTDDELLAFTRRLVSLRARHPVLRRTHWLVGHAATNDDQLPDGALPDSAWFAPDGHEMNELDWSSPTASSVVLFLNGSVIGATDDHGRPIEDDSLLIIFHNGGDDVEFVLPHAWWGSAWTVELDTAGRPDGRPLHDIPLRAGACVVVRAESVVLLRSAAGRPAQPAAVSPFEA